MKLALAVFTCVLAASAAGIDGQWKAEVSARGKKAAAAPASAPANTFTLNLKTQDGQVTGSVAVAGKKKPRQQTIQNAKLDGNQLTFKTVQTGKKKESVTFSWQVTVDGDQMTGTRTREGTRRGVTFKARKSG
jgi:hypothetical protein